MFNQLTASRPRRPRSSDVGSAIGATAVHIGLLTAAVVGTRSPAPSVPPPEPVADLFLLPSERTSARVPAAASGPGIRLSVPSSDPIEIPPVPSLVVDPVGRPGLVVGGSPVAEPRRGSAFAALGGERAAPSGSGAWQVETVDEPPVRIDGRDPTYPPHLRASRTEGIVVVAFVVDTAGRVEPGSLRFVRTAHSGFGPAVRRQVLRYRYLPARVRGRPVRVLVEQQFRFRLRGMGRQPPPSGAHGRRIQSSAVADRPGALSGRDR